MDDNWDKTLWFERNNLLLGGGGGLSYFQPPCMLTTKQSCFKHLVKQTHHQTNYRNFCKEC